MACNKRDPMFKQRHFDDEIILLCVRWYISYKLSYRDLTENDIGARPSDGAPHNLSLGSMLRSGIRETVEPIFASRWHVMASRRDVCQYQGEWHYL